MSPNRPVDVLDDALLGPEGLIVHYPNRYPRLAELIAHGGTPGFSYCLVNAVNTGKFQGYGWQQVRDLPVLSIGQCDSVFLMCKGKVIPGASPHNGRRPYYVDISLSQLTGIPVPGTELSDRPATENQVAKAREENASHAGQKRPQKEQAA